MYILPAKQRDLLRRKRAELRQLRKRAVQLRRITRRIAELEAFVADMGRLERECRTQGLKVGRKPPLGVRLGLGRAREKGRQMERVIREREIANNMLTMTRGDFEAWLQSKCPADQPETPYGVYLTAYLAGLLGEEWARLRANVY